MYFITTRANFKYLPLQMDSLPEYSLRGCNDQLPSTSEVLYCKDSEHGNRLGFCRGKTDVKIVR